MSGTILGDITGTPCAFDRSGTRQETTERNGKTCKRFRCPERIERVKKYERLFDEISVCPDKEKIRLLEAYYTSGEWLEDYTADENGEFPPELKRGILSQDALYDLLERLK